MSGIGVFLDIGANRGIYSYVAQRVGFDVVACEPNQSLASYISAWSKATVDVREVAASASSGEVLLAIPTDERGRALDGLASAEVNRVRREALGFTQIRVTSASIDDLGLTGLSFIKIDVEGHEQEVLRGALNTLRTQKPILQVEIEERHRPGSLPACRELLAGLGYSGYFIRNGTITGLEGFVPEIHQHPDRIGDRNDYVNNFYFTVSQDQVESLLSATSENSTR